MSEVKKNSELSYEELQAPPTKEPVPLLIERFTLLIPTPLRVHAALNSEDLMNLHDKIESNLKDSGVEILRVLQYSFTKYAAHKAEEAKK